MTIEELNRHTEEAMKALGCPIEAQDRVDAFRLGVISMARFLAARIEQQERGSLDVLEKEMKEEKGVGRPE